MNTVAVEILERGLRNLHKEGKSIRGLGDCLRY